MIYDRSAIDSDMMKVVYTKHVVVSYHTTQQSGVHQQGLEPLLASWLDTNPFSNALSASYF